jgi:hypothetical protein
LTREFHNSPLRQALAFAQYFHETDFDDDPRGSPGKRPPANERGVGFKLASRLGVEGDERSKPSRKFGEYITALRGSANSYAFR